MAKENLTLDQKIDTLAETIAGGFKSVDNKLENLAIMTQGEFNRLDKRLDSLVNEVLAIKIDLEQIRSSLAGVAYRFEIQDLEKRLEVIENKLGINGSQAS